MESILSEKRITLNEMYTLIKRLLSPERWRQNNTKITGFTDKEYVELCDLIYQRWLDEDSVSVTELRDGVGRAVGQLVFKSNSNDYVAYVSKTPIVGYFEHPDECVTLKGYHSGYENLDSSFRR